MKLKPTVATILCSAAVLVAGCAKAPPAKPPLNVPVVTILDDSALLSAGTRADKVLSPAGIHTSIAKDAYSQHFSISVPLAQHEQATQLLKQDAEFQKYNVRFFELSDKLRNRARLSE